MMKNKHAFEIRKGTFKRLFSYLGKYKLRLIVVFFCIVISSLAGAFGSLFLQNLIDDNIIPMMESVSKDYSPLLHSLVFMGCIYIFGIVSTYVYNVLMCTVAQGVLRDIRDDMFSKMQHLPIRYFDTHPHGDIMSRYTNDTDTLRQMIAQSTPQMLSSLMTIIVVLFSIKSKI